MVPNRVLSAALLPLLLAGCIFGGSDEKPRGPRIIPALRDPSPRETQQCYADLSRMNARFTPIPDRDFGGGCRVAGAVQLLDIGVPVTGIKSMRCPLARSFVGWLHESVAPAAERHLGARLVRVETFGSYACRNVVGSAAASNRLSGHGFANAVDVSGFVFADGRRISVLAGWRGADEGERDFWAEIRDSACRRFGTVLSPDYNAAHQNHLHLEADAARFCR